MKFCLSAALVVFFSMSALADEDVKKSECKAKKVDTKKYCYYQNLEFSPGSVVNQVGYMKRCVRSESGVLYWE